MIRKLFLFVTLLAAAIGGQWFNTASAQSLLPVPPDADARLANDTNRGPTSNTGSSSLWEVRWHEAPRIRIGYVRYDITGFDSSLFNTATLRGTFRDSSRNGPGDGSGMWDVYGLNDVTTTGQGNNWIESGEGSINYSNASGVDNSALIDTFAFNSDATFLGTMSFDGNDVQPLPFASNSTDLPLGSFLNADTDGLVTFMFMSSSQDGHEYHIDSKEGNMSGGHGPMTLNFVVPDGDVDGINGVDLVDLQIIADNFRQSVTSRIQGDLTNDNFVDFDDFDQWKRNYNGSLANLNLDFLTGTQVPEPTSAVLAALAIGGASIAVRCRRAKVRSLASRS